MQGEVVGMHDIGQLVLTLPWLTLRTASQSGATGGPLQETWKDTKVHK